MSVNRRQVEEIRVLDIYLRSAPGQGLGCPIRFKKIHFATGYKYELQAFLKYIHKLF